MGCGASVENRKANGAPSQAPRIKVNRARRFNTKDGLGDEFSMHAKLSMYMLFAKYDVDASGEIDANELYKMMLDTLPIKSTAQTQDFDEQDFDLLAAALDDADEAAAPTLDNVHDMMYAIGVEPTENSMVQGGELLLSETLFVEWMLGGMKRSRKDRDEFAQENEIQRKMVNFLEALSKMIGRTVASIEFLFNNGSGSDEEAGYIESDELYAIMFKARKTRANVEMRAALLGEDPNSIGVPPLCDHEYLESFVRACDETAQIGETPKLSEDKFVQYLLNVFQAGPQKRRQAMRSDSLLVSLCGLLAFVEKNALPAMTSTERTGGGTAPMRTIALSCLFQEHDRDEDGNLNGSEFRKLVRACAKRQNYKLGPQDEDGIEEFMLAFDKDSDAMISHDEWVDFMSTTMKIPKNDRIGKYGHYAVLQQYCFDSVALLERFLKFAVNELTNILKQARGKKKDKSMPITPPELQRLVVSCIDALDAAGLPEEIRRKAREPKLEDLKNCIKFMDKNGDGELQEGEFVESCLKSIMQSAKSRKKATKKADSGPEINAFLAVIRAETQRRVLRSAAGGIFRKFDRRMKGEINENGIVLMIEGIAGHHETLPPWEDHAAAGSWKKVAGENPKKLFGRVLMEVMDEDGDGLLQEEEFVSYMAKTIMRTRAAEETRTGDVTYDELESSGISPEQKKLLLGEMLHIMEMELPYIGL